jgi:acyl-coenzyme A thioesterase PaaI-like protein
MRARPSPGAQLREAWRRLSPLPGGKWLFSRFLGRMNRYSGSTGALVETLEPGYVRVVLKDRAAVRNHLDSVHAIALANVAELASGLAILTALPPTARGIPVRITIEYLKKARGTLTAESRCALPDVSVDGEHAFSATVRDQAGDDVARATVTWKLGPMA